MTALTPDRKRAIALDNLALARDVQHARGRLRREIIGLGRGAGCHRVAELLTDLPPELETVPVVDVLRWIRMVGISQARGILRTTGVRNERRQLRMMTPREREAVARHLTNASRRESSR